MKRTRLLSALFCASLALCTGGLAQSPSAPPTASPAPTPFHVIDTDKEPIAPGKFQPTWESLSQYQIPEWFRDAKFGIWAHWGPQCEAEDGDWYARNMYFQGSPQYNYQLAHFGHPSKVGFKDVAHDWKAENWDPENLVALYKRAGAQYFFAMGNHHDNFDMWDSTYQPWNAVKVGPQKDIIGGWAKAARDNGLPFGVSLHAAHAWNFYEITQGSDKTGPLAGVPYDGKLKASDGAGQWWDGLDPQDLYAQNHVPSEGWQNSSMIHKQWQYLNGSSIPDQAYCDKFYNRTADLIKKYHPDLIYFDDSVMPLWPISDAGLKIAADFYNSNMQLHGGKLEGVMFGKDLNDDQRKCIALDIERGRSNKIEPLPWQTDTCIGNWHYQRSLFDHHKYKTAKTVIQSLADIVSKNGNLLLNIPVRADGTIDSDELAVVQDIAKWMDVNKESIFGTRPWKIFGEGPASEIPASTRQGGLSFNEKGAKPFTADDIRFTSKGNTLYGIVLGVPNKPLNIKSLGNSAGLVPGKISSISLLGDTNEVHWTQNDDALEIDPPISKPATDYAIVYKISLTN
jgi:alpha-L-fucosidase